MAVMETWRELTYESFQLPLGSLCQKLKISPQKAYDGERSLLAIGKALYASPSRVLWLAEGVLTEFDFLQALFEARAAGLEFAQVDPFRLARPIKTSRPPGTSVYDGLQSLRISQDEFLPLEAETGDEYTFVHLLHLLEFFVFEFDEEFARYQLCREAHAEGVTIQDEDFLLDHGSEGATALSGSVFLHPITRLVSDWAASARPGESVQGAWVKMFEGNQRCLVLREYETTLKGILTFRDLLRSWVKAAPSNWQDHDVWASQKLEQVATLDPEYLFARHNLVHAMNFMHDGQYRQIIVVDEDRVPLGVVGLGQILRFIARFLPGESGPL